jgi:hypothetical protein
MRIEYSTPRSDDMSVSIRLADGTLAITTDENVATTAVCAYEPEPIAGYSTIGVGKFRATGQGGRVVDAEVVFDLRRGTFVIRPKKLESEGFEFDKPVAATSTELPPKVKLA